MGVPMVIVEEDDNNCYGNRYNKNSNNSNHDNSDGDDNDDDDKV